MPDLPRDAESQNGDTHGLAYQLQQSSGTGIVYASLIIAAIPTLLVFVACQNVIMRGIVVFVEK